MNPVRLVGAFALLLAVWPSAASAQVPCRFVLGFAELAAQLGESIVGTCTENERIITGTNEQFESVGGGVSVKVLPRDAVQQTTRGVMIWRPSTTSTYFYTDREAYALGAGAAPIASRPNAGASLPPSTSATPNRQSQSPPPTGSGSGASASRCFNAASTALLSVPLTAPEADLRRAEAEADAITHLCGRALDEDGTRGVDCFFKAWDAAKGMERVFVGSGTRTYDEKYRSCMNGR